MTLQQIREAFLLLIRESTDDAQASHFTTTEIRGFANEAKDFLAALSASTKDDVSVAVETNVGAYTLPSDTILIKHAYYGNVSKVGGVKPLKVLSEKILTDLHPGWREETTQSTGEPVYLIRLDRQTIFVFPRPNSDQSGKRIFISYAYKPAALANDSDEPDIPLVFHPILKLYMGYLAYLNLTNPDMATKMWGDFITQYNLLKDTADREAEDIYRWKWGYQP